METSRVSGPAKNLIEFARYAGNPQSPLRADITMATFRRGALPASDEFTVACEQAGLDVHLIRERFLFDPAVIWAMRRLVAERAPDIVQTHSVKSHFLMRLSGMYRQCHWIAFHHGYTWTSTKARIYNYLDRVSLPSATRVVTVCGAFASTLEDIGVKPERIVIRHNSVNAFVPATDDRVTQLREALRIEPGTQILLTVGRLSREKGHRDLIKALTLLRREDRSRKMRLIILGDGPDNQKLRDVAKRFAVDNCVTFAGHQSDVRTYYSLADLMVLPSHTEGSPNCLLEAMAAGLPIVATAVGGVPEIVGAGQAAILVEKENPAALADAIAHVLYDVSLRAQISTAARSTAAAYSPQSYCDSMLSLYHSCLAEEQQDKTRRAKYRSSTTSGDSGRVLTD